MLHNPQFERNLHKHYGYIMQKSLLLNTFVIKLLPSKAKATYQNPPGMDHKVGVGGRSTFQIGFGISGHYLLQAEGKQKKRTNQIVTSTKPLLVMVWGFVGPE